MRRPISHTGNGRCAARVHPPPVIPRKGGAVAGGTGERVVREPLTGRVAATGDMRARKRTGRRARNPDPLRGQGPLPLRQDPQRRIRDGVASEG
jgi:hypothetical protein